MKIWLKYLLGCVLGIIMAAVLPVESSFLQNTVSFCSEFAIRFGRYMLVPLVFFSMTVSVCKLRDSGELLKTALKTGAVIVGASLLVTVFGLVTALLIRLPRIPISVEKISQIASLDVKDHLLALFPYSAFDVFKDGAFLLPVFVFAGFIGAGCASDRIAAKPIFTLFVSLSHIVWSVMSFFIDMFSVGLIAVSCMWTIQFIDVLGSGVFNGLIILLFADFLFLIFAVYPAVLRFTFKELHPYRVLYASTASVLAAFFSGDSNLALAVNLRHAKESLGIKRRMNAVVMPLFSAFSRGGAAFVTTIGFVIILRSYSSLGISVYDVFWIGLFSFLISFLLSGLPVGGPFVALTVLCSLYGRGFDSAYLLLKPVAPVLCAFAAAVDAATAMFGSYLIAWKSGRINHMELKKFI